MWYILFLLYHIYYFNNSLQSLIHLIKDVNHTTKYYLDQRLQLYCEIFIFVEHFFSFLRRSNHTLPQQLLCSANFDQTLWQNLQLLNTFYIVTNLNDVTLCINKLRCHRLWTTENKKKQHQWKYGRVVTIMLFGY